MAEGDEVPLFRWRLTDTSIHSPPKSWQAKVSADRGEAQSCGKHVFPILILRLLIFAWLHSGIFAKCFETDHMISSDRTQKQNLSFDYSFAAVEPTGLIGIAEMQKTSKQSLRLASDKQGCNSAGSSFTAAYRSFRHHMASIATEFQASPKSVVVVSSAG